MGVPSERDKLIRFRHCDPAGFVFHPQHFVLFNERVGDWFNPGLQRNYADLVYQDRLGLPMVKLQSEFLSASPIGETLGLSQAVRRIGRGSLEPEVFGRSGDTDRLRAQPLVVLADADWRRSVPNPDDLRRRVEACMAA